MNILRTDKEQRLLNLFDRGDATAMDKLYAEYADYLTGVCYRYIGNDDDLKDVLQEAFIKIFTQIGTFKYRGKGSLKAWLTRIVINESLMFLRNKKKENIVDLDIGSDYTNFSEDNLPQDATNNGNSIPSPLGRSGEVSGQDSGEPPIPVFDFIAKLPPGYRAVFNLYAIEGLSHQEIAKRLGITQGTSASQFHKARVMLAKMIKEYKRKNEYG